MAYILIGGFCMALADSVPGVSGGTIAFILGFYDTFIGSLSDLFHGTGEEKAAAVKFLLKLGCGWVVGMALAVTLLGGVFTTGIYQVSSLFLGFVMASIPLIFMEERRTLSRDQKYLVFVAFGAALVVGLSMFNLSSSVQNLGFSPWTALYVFAAGALAICAMVLPGISGSSLLMSFGLYVPVITTAKEVLSFHFDNLWLLVFLALGIFVGVFFAMQGIKSLFEHHRAAVVYAVFGMMLGSFYAIIMGPTTLKVPQHSMTWSDFNLPLFLIGCLAVFALSFFKAGMEKRRQKNELDTEY